MSRYPPLSPLRNIKKAAEQAATMKSRSERIDKLSDAFEMFSKETVRLEAAYDSISKQFAAVNCELEESNRKLKEKILELDQTTHYLDSILTNMTQGLIFVTLEGIVSTYTPLAYQILEVSGTKVIEQCFWDSFPDELFGFSMKQALQLKQAPKLSYVKLSPNDNFEEERELEIQTSFMLKNPLAPPQHQEIEGMIVLIRDITEVRRLELKAQRNHRLKSLGEMAAMVVHEIRNPLGGVRGFSALLAKDLVDQPGELKLVNEIIKGTDELNLVLNNILNYTRPIQIDLQEVNLLNLIKEILEYVQLDPHIKAKAKFTFHAPKENLILSADPRLLKSALLNLILNGADAIEEKGKIFIQIRETRRWIYLEVKDTGIGLPEQSQNEIFKPFFTTKPHGNGLGLAEVEKIVLAHEGKIEVKSIVGKGTVFIMKLPRKHGY